MKNTIVVAGHLCLDLTPVFPQTAGSLEKVLVPGSLVEMGEMNIALGGAVSNTGLGLKKMGSDVRLMGLVGDDDLGKLVLKRYRDFNAEGDIVVSKNTSTSYSVVIAPPGCDRIFLHNPGSNNDFTPDILNYDVIFNSALFHFGYPTIMRRMYDDGGERLAKMFKLIHGSGVLTSLDMAAVDENSPAAHADWINILEKTLPHVDFFVPSIDEISYMLKMQGQDPEKIAERLLQMGAGAVMIKCGTQGIFLSVGKKCTCLNEYNGHLPCFKPRRVRSATGAGDTSIAAFLKAVTEGYNAETALKFAIASGTCCVEEYDAISGLMTFPRLRERFSI